MTLLAVYGTLLRDLGNHHFIKDQEFFANDSITGIKMYGYAFGFPACVQTDDDADKVYVEIYDVDKEALERVDQLEGHPNWYKRTAVLTDSFIECEIYLMQKEDVGERRPIPSGCWRSHIEARKEKDHIYYD